MGKLLILGLLLLASVYACQAKDCFVERENQILFNGDCMAAYAEFWVAQKDFKMHFLANAGPFETRSARFYYGRCDTGDMVIERENDAVARLRRLSDNENSKFPLEVLVWPGRLFFGHYSSGDIIQNCAIEFAEKDGGYAVEFWMYFDSEPTAFSIIMSKPGIRILSQTDKTAFVRYWWFFKIILPILGLLVFGSSIAGGIGAYCFVKIRNRKKRAQTEDLEANQTTEVSITLAEKKSETQKSEPKKKKKKKKKKSKKKPKKSEKEKEKKEKPRGEVNAEVIEPLPETQTTILQTRPMTQFDVAQKPESTKQVEADPKSEPKPADPDLHSATDVSVEPPPQKSKKKSVEYQTTSDGNKIYHLRALKKPKDTEKRTEEEELADL